MARRAQSQTARQTSTAPLAVFAVLFVFSLLGMIYFMFESNSLKTQIQSGYTPGRDPSRYEQIEPGAPGYIALLIDKDQELRNEWAEVEAFKRLTGVKSARDIQDRLADLKADNLFAAIHGQTATINSLDEQLKTTVSNRATLEQEFQASKEDSSRRIQGLQREVEQLIREKRESERASLEDKNRIERSRDELRRRIDGLEEQIETARRTHREEIARAAREVAVARRALEEVQRAKVGHTDFNIDTAEPDGRVLTVSRVDRSVMVDIGHRDGAKAGLQFVVYETGAGGVRREKGRIELKQVFDTFSYGGIIEVKDALNPILEHDIVISPVFKRGQVGTFVFENDIDRFEQAVLKEKIERFGNRVSLEVTAETDYVVIKSAPGEMALEAGKWAVPVIRVSDLSRVLGD